VFKVRKSQISSVRLGIIRTNSGVVNTPFFMPDATRGFVKSLPAGDLKKIKMGPMVVNAYHLYLRPGVKRIKRAGGMHKFMNWSGPLLSDSGGFQIFSLIYQKPQMGDIADKQVVFKSPIDGSRRIITPEKSIQIQFDLGVDMMVALDDCPPNDCKKKDLREAVVRTIFWAKRCAKEYDKQIANRKSQIANYRRPMIFAVIQGGADLELRKKCFEGLQEVAPRNGWDGFGYGARPVDARGIFLDRTLEYTANLIPENKIRFALGVGTPEDVVRCVKMGWDMFDCVIPTREGRHGRLFFQKSNYKLKISNSKQVLSEFQVPQFYKTANIVNSKFADDFSPINQDSKIKELREHSKAYLHHLFKLKEPLGQRLATLNNLEFYLDLMEMLRK